MTYYLVRKYVGANYLPNVLMRVQPVICVKRRSYAHDIEMNLSGGPVNILKQRITKGDLMNDAHQVKVAQTLQGIYQEIHDYKPQLNILEKWFRGKRSAPKGLYIYGSVGGGKTMLMDLFYNCCQVSPGLPLAQVLSMGSRIKVALKYNFIILSLSQITQT